ncbi:MAG: VWA domain-containing protein [Candidatus Sulfotelmatobacter sp.]
MAQLPRINTGADSGFSEIDLAQIYLDTQSRDNKKSEQQLAENKKLVDSGIVSALDLAAPGKAVDEFNRASFLLKAQNSKEAIKHLQKAIQDYPKFVSAHIGLGCAYSDQEDKARAKSEFETAAKLDDKFAASFLNLGVLDLSAKDFADAQPALEKAAFLRPADARILSTLAYAQDGNHQYQQTIQTAQRVHTLDHKGMANVHYVAASAAMSLGDMATTERELNLFLSEDPTNAFAPTARKNLAILAHNKKIAERKAIAGNLQLTTTGSAALPLQTFPNSDRLKAELSAVGEESGSGPCDDCGTLAEANPSAVNGNNGVVSDVTPGLSSRASSAWTIRTSVDDVALFFAVSSHGHMVNDLEQTDIQVRDDGKAPARVLQFAPQSKLPLRLALLVDTSGSVHDRFAFEKRAAARFVQKMLSNSSDLAFVAGFSNEISVTQDFNSDSDELGKGIEKLTNGGGTALFDAVSFACSKLAEYPDGERVARVLVILSDGEDNSSHRSLKQSIQAAERAGVTIYAISAREDIGDKTDADKVLELLAERTGGDAMFPHDLSTLGKSFDKLHDLIRSRYFIAYKPTDFKPNGSYRTINIIAEKDGKRLQVRARKGYRARLEAGPN